MGQSSLGEKLGLDALDDMIERVGQLENLIRTFSFFLMRLGCTEFCPFWVTDEW